MIKSLIKGFDKWVFGFITKKFVANWVRFLVQVYIETNPVTDVTTQPLANGDRLVGTSVRLGNGEVTDASIHLMDPDGETWLICPYSMSDIIEQMADHVTK